jgi:uncharacterized protein YbjT (DUF2867 family)
VSDFGARAQDALRRRTLSDGSSQLNELTGRRMLTFEDAVAEIASATGRSIRYVQVSAEDFAAALTAEELPTEIAWPMNYPFSTVLDGRNAHVTDGVRRGLGRETRDFGDYVRAAAATGAWDVVGVGPSVDFAAPRST